ncbi:hypothetical protein M6D81_01260 [Paenibacillus sp. J5C_2022]|uniref:hypothetical protein n=1 Tax=Paenibacillus sp. J5C2022 TaxID=2977129 RepID=UPI0021D03A72|nr:hypothetical protein [Paenibacillus sp. J5C2022]MCU6707323.1 hypothetical protein [Paenibacillus sp. J5C2022]
MLGAASYVDIDIDATLQHSDLLGLEGFREQFDVQRFRRLYEKGILDSEEYEQLHRISEELQTSQESYAMMNFIMGCGTKPIMASNSQQDNLQC